MISSLLPVPSQRRRRQKRRRSSLVLGAAKSWRFCTSCGADEARMDLFGANWLIDTSHMAENMNNNLAVLLWQVLLKTSVCVIGYHIWKERKKHNKIPCRIGKTADSYFRET